MFIVQIAGRLGKDPETRFTPSGQKVTTFTVAVNHRKGKEDVTTWVRTTIWGDRFDKIMSYLKKGSAVVVVGRMNPPSSYTDKEGRMQFTLEVTAEMIEFSPFGNPDRVAEGNPNQQGYQQSQTASDYAASSPSHSPSHAYEETAFQSNASTYGKGNYGATPQGSGSSTMDDDALPF